MPLQQLANHFNDRFAHEHQARFRPFSVENHWVSGLFGPIRISSGFSPVRQAQDFEAVVGHIAQLTVATHHPNNGGSEAVEIAALMTDTIKGPEDFQAIINLDRLTRTVHMLNYLSYAALRGVLFLDVDPRHVLSVKENHGVYFEEIIIKCGLATSNVAISLTLTPYFALHYEPLLEGLNNYRQRGYQIALNVGELYAANGVQDFLSKLLPQYLRVDAPKPEASAENNAWPSALAALLDLQHLIGGQTLLQGVEEAGQAMAALAAGVDWVQGSHYDKAAVDHLRCL